MMFVWDEAAAVQPLRGTQIRVYAADLDGLDVHHSAQLLSPDELSRVERFHFQRDRSRFIIARATLRTILCQYLDVVPARIEFAYGANGKPTLANTENADQILHFNVSHARGLALYALSYCAPLGVDVEFLRPISDMTQIATSYFSKSESAALSAVPASKQAQAFYKCWTTKEAIIKATGDGLSFALDRFDVELRPERASRLLRLDGDTGRAAAWTIKELTPSPGFVGALAIRRRDVSISCKAWRSDVGTRS
jgi:4'-phosphopantetheinyl transferase